MASPEPISFARGAPSADIMPAGTLRDAAQRILGEDAKGALGYGVGSGYAPLRQWVADRHEVEPEHVLVTNGSLQGGVMLFDELVEPGVAVVVEAPSYDRTLLALDERGADLLALPLESDGLDIGALEASLNGGARPRFIHTIPNFHNPAGCTLSLAKRRRLLELAAEYDFLIFEDDPYAELRFEGENLPRMLEMDTSDRIVYASSFSKTIAPGVRVGYLIGPPDLIARITRAAVSTYISPNMLSEAIVYEFCRSGAIEESIATVKRALRARRDALAEGLRGYIGEDARFVLPEGGYFLWVELPEEVDTSELHTLAAERGVTFVAGRDFMIEGGSNALRLAYSAVTPEQADEGARRLAESLAALREGAAAA
ncbi:MAG: aminotransferase class I/II [Candidatus Rokuibacteriota bacterium]|nr:MAG: aminotransferase class I/II [Candidatus Rokubacteria bacterium]